MLFPFDSQNSLLPFPLLNNSCQDHAVILCHALSHPLSLLWVIIVREADWWTQADNSLDQSRFAKNWISCHVGSSVNHWATFLSFLLSFPSLCIPYCPWSVKKMPKRVLSVLVYTLGRVVQAPVPVMTVKNSLLGIFALKLPAILLPFLIEITSSVCQGHLHAGFVFCCFLCSCEARSQCIGNDCL